MRTPGFDYRAADDEFDARWARARLGRPGPGGPYPGAPGYDLPGYHRGGYGRGGYGRWAGGPRPGFRMLPFPSYSTRTRRGTNVSVGGCCLPIPIGCLTTTVLAAATAVVVGRSGRS
jgi:hypothetical protein